MLLEVAAAVLQLSRTAGGGKRRRDNPRISSTVSSHRNSTMGGTRRRRGRSVSGKRSNTHKVKSTASVCGGTRHTNSHFSVERKEYLYELPPHAEHRNIAAQSNPKGLVVGTARARSPLSAATRIPGFVSAATLLARQPAQTHMAFMSGRGSSSTCDRRRTALLAAAVSAQTCQLAASTSLRPVLVAFLSFARP